jgi:hypothetical protein
MKFSKYILGAVLATTIFTGCTNLDETLYDQVGTQNYYNTKMDVVRATFVLLNMLIGAFSHVMSSMNFRLTS